MTKLERTTTIEHRTLESVLKDRCASNNTKIVYLREMSYPIDGFSPKDNQLEENHVWISYDNLYFLSFWTFQNDIGNTLNTSIFRSTEISNIEYFKIEADKTILKDKYHKTTFTAEAFDVFRELIPNKKHIETI